MARGPKSSKPFFRTFAEALRHLMKSWQHRRRSSPTLRVRLCLEQLEDRCAFSVTPFGSEFLVNTYTNGDQQTWSNGPPGPPVASQVAAINPTDGSYVIAWASHGQINTGWDVYARLYNADGAPQGSPFLVNTTTTSDQEAPDVAMNSNGDFVIAWQTHQNGRWDVAAQRYSANGTAQGSQMIVANPNGDDQTAPSVALDSAGNFVLAWTDNSQGSWRVLAQRFSAAGAAQGSQIVVSPSVSANEQDPSVSMDSAGDFVVAWAGHQSGSWDIYAKRYNASGVAQGGPFLVNTTTANDQETPSLAMDAAGNFVVTWASNNQAGNGWEVYAQRYDSTGAAQGSEFQVNTYTNGDQQNPMAAMSPSGQFVITWSSENQDGNGWGVYAQQYDAGGNAQGGEFRVNTYTNGDQQYSAAAMSDQHLLVAWSSHNQDGNGWGVYGQQYNLSGIRVTPTSGLTTTKAGGTATFSVVLTNKPTANVIINLSSSNTQEGTLSTSSLTFTPLDWNVAQAVTITGQNDFILGNVAYSINLAAAQSSDPSYNGLIPSSVSVTNQQVALPGVTITPLTPLTTTETGGTAQLNVVLNSQPLFNVYILISSSDTTAGTVSTNGFLFTPADWNVAQTVTVTGVDDQVVTPDRSYIVKVGAAQSTDLAYNGLFASSLNMTNQEADVAGVTVTPITPLTTTESGGTAQFTVVLTSQPLFNVVIPISSSDTTAGTVSTNSLTFTPANWNVARTVTITGADDQIVTPDRTYAVNIGAAQSTDSNYNGQFVSSLSLTDTETDSAGVTVTPTTPLTTTESGGTAQFTVVLTSQPTANVVIPISSSDTSAGGVSANSLTFTPTNWSVAQTVTVTGVDDQVVTPDRSYTVNIGAAQSTDTYYSGQFASSLNMTNTETDSPGVIVTALTPLTLTPDWPTVSFTVALASMPTANVVFNLSTSAPGGCLLSVSSLTFTPANWNQAQEVEVTASTSSTSSADQAYSVVFSPALSSDLTYNGWQVASVNLVSQGMDGLGTTIDGGSSDNSSPTGPDQGPVGSGSSPVLGSQGPAQTLVAPSLPGILDTGQTIIQGAASAAIPIVSAIETPASTVAVAASAGVNAGSMTVARLLPVMSILSTSLSGGGGGAALASAGPAEPKSNPELPPSTEQALKPAPPVVPVNPREAAPVVLPQTPASLPAPLAIAQSTPPLSFPAASLRTDLLLTHFDEAERVLETPARSQKVVDAVFASGIVTSVGYVVFSGRGTSWLLSALTARPLWKQFDPLEILFAWETEKKQRRLGEADSDSEEDETLQSLVK